LIEPVGYFENLKLIKNSDLVITDSGGVVKEAYWSKKISILLMERPVWPELVALDSCVNVKSDYDEILNTYDKLINMKPVFDSDVYGVGDASKKIAKILCKN
jgi:UDP-GlcNAc3NAcA epimerase